MLWAQPRVTKRLARTHRVTCVEIFSLPRSECAQLQAIRRCFRSWISPSPTLLGYWSLTNGNNLQQCLARSVAGTAKKRTRKQANCLRAPPWSYPCYVGMLWIRLLFKIHIIVLWIFVVLSRAHTDASNLLWLRSDRDWLSSPGLKQDVNTSP